MIHSFAVILMGLMSAFFLNMSCVHSAPQLTPQCRKAVKEEISSSADIPQWVTHTPRHSFVGISRPCRSIAEARQQACDSALSQVLQAMGAKYELKHTSRVSGSASGAHHKLKESLVYSARWVVRSVQEAIRAVEIQKSKGGYTCFVLVCLTPAKIADLRRLSTGPRVSARVVKEENDRVFIEVRETNGVRVTFTTYAMELTTRNLHAGIITMFACKMPVSSSKTFEAALDHTLTIKGSSSRISLLRPPPQSGLMPLLLGSRRQMSIRLKGHDEGGHEVWVAVTVR